MQGILYNIYYISIIYKIIVPKTFLHLRESFEYNTQNKI